MVLEGGDGPPLAGPVFMARWNAPNQTLEDFCYTTRTFMPKDLPDSLDKQ